MRFRKQHRRIALAVGGAGDCRAWESRTWDRAAEAFAKEYLVLGAQEYEVVGQQREGGLRSRVAASGGPYARHPRGPTLLCEVQDGML